MLAMWRVFIATTQLRVVGEKRDCFVIIATLAPRLVFSLKLCVAVAARSAFGKDRVRKHAAYYRSQVTVGHGS